MTEQMKMIISTGIMGEQTRGSNGAVLIDDESSDIVYLLSHEFKPIQFAEKLNELLTDDNNVHLFVVTKTKDSMHISKIPKQ